MSTYNKIIGFVSAVLGVLCGLVMAISSIPRLGFGVGAVYFLTFGLSGVLVCVIFNSIAEALDRLENIERNTRASGELAESTMRTTDFDSKEEERELANGTKWKCHKCGKVHYSYETSCSCGAFKE